MDQALDDTQQALITKHLDLVHYCARKLEPKLSRNHPTNYDDLVSAGMVGLVDAALKFDPERGLKFITMAMTRVNGAILDYLRKVDTVPRDTKGFRRRMRMAKKVFMTQFSRQPTDSEIAEVMGVDVETVWKSHLDVQRRVFHTLERPAGNDDEHSVTLADMIPGNDNVENNYLNDEANKVLRQNIAKLKEQEATVLRLYYFEDMTLKEIGGVLDLTEARICQIRAKALANMRKLMT